MSGNDSGSRRQQKPKHVKGGEVASTGGDVVVREFTRGQRIFANIVLIVCFLVVGGSAFWVSYEHIRFVTELKHQPWHLALVYPLTVDGMLGIGAVTLWHDSVRGMKGRLWARVVFWLGLGASIAANVVWYVAVWGWDPVGVAVAAWPAAALLLSIEVVTNPSQRRKVVKGASTAVAEAERRIRSAATAATTPSSGPAAVPAQPDAAQTTTGGQQRTVEPSTAEQPSPVTVPVSVPARTLRREGTEPLDSTLVEMALQVGRAWRERTGREITRDGLRTGLRDAGWHRGISNVTAGRLLDVIRNDADGSNGGDGQDSQRAAAVAANGR